jgi:uncharacterized low-complexity protein
MRIRARFIISNALLSGVALALCLAFVPSAPARPAQAASNSNDVYVCACGTTKSCPCMAMSAKEGKCPCGHDDMKAVARNGDWAKTNRKALR